MNRLSSLLDRISGVVNLVFKLAILICIAIFLFLYYRSTEINRYQYVKSEDESDVLFKVFDTKTGLIHVLVPSNEEKKLPSKRGVFDPISGTATVKEHKINK
jgi:hypothetical protein